MANVLDLALFGRDGVRAEHARVRATGLRSAGTKWPRCEARAGLVAGSQKKRVALEVGTVKGKRHCDAPGDRSHDRPGQGRARRRVPKRESNTLFGRVCVRASHTLPFSLRSLFADLLPAAPFLRWTRFPVRSREICNVVVFLLTNPLSFFLL